MSHRILVVDDSAMTRAMIRRIIGMCGVEVESVIEAGDGADALAKLAQSPVDLIVADLHMPVMGGLKMLRHMLLKPELRNIPVVVVSADPQAGCADELTKCGVKGFLSKPFTPEAFRELFERVLGVTHA